jgi:hypothetical protein
MSIDTYFYFLIVLSGFFTVRSYRWAQYSLIRHNEDISDFEYLGYSAFWGVVILVLFEWLERHHASLITMFISNPLGAGFCLSLLGMVVGASAYFLLVTVKSVFTA